MGKAIVLLSGGLDSCVSLALALSMGWTCYPLAFDYKQRHKREVSSAHQITAHYQNKGAPIRDLTIISLVGLDLASSLTDERMEVPRKPAEPGAVTSTYVPSRNAIFFSVAMGLAESLGADTIWSGVRSASDCVGYPDNRRPFIQAMEKALNLGTERGTRGNGVELVTPCLTLRKDEIVLQGLTLNAPLGLTWSCYVGQDRPCGECGICRTRAKAFAELGVPDPALVLP